VKIRHCQSSAQICAAPSEPSAMNTVSVSAGRDPAIRAFGQVPWRARARRRRAALARPLHALARAGKLELARASVASHWQLGPLTGVRRRARLFETAVRLDSVLAGSRPEPPPTHRCPAPSPRPSQCHHLSSAVTWAGCNSINGGALQSRLLGSVWWLRVHFSSAWAL